MRAARWMRARTPLSFPDTVQAARIGAWSASLRWDPEGGQSFDAWCYWRARHAVRDEWRTVSNLNRSHPELRALPVCPHDLIDLHQVGEVDEYPSDGHSEATRAAMGRIAARVTPTQRRLLELLAIGLTKHDASVTLGITDGAVSHTLQRIRAGREDWPQAWNDERCA